MLQTYPKLIHVAINLLNLCAGIPSASGITSLSCVVFEMSGDDGVHTGAGVCLNDDDEGGDGGTPRLLFPRPDRVRIRDGTGEVHIIVSLSSISKPKFIKFRTDPLSYQTQEKTRSE